MIPYVFGEVAAGEPVHADAVGQCVVALAADGLALARGERGEEVVERRVAGVLPVELLVGALQETEFAEETKFRLGGEGDVDAGGAVDAAQLNQAGGERLAHVIRIRTRAHQQAPSGRRRKRHRDL